MKRSATRFLQVVLAIFGLAALAFMLWEPHVEGRNAHATVYEVYFHDPFLAYAYMASIPFFLGLYQAFKVLGYVGQDQMFTPAAVTAARTIRYCAVGSIGFVAVSVLFMPITDVGDDRPQGIVMRLVLTFVSLVVVAVAAMLERIFQHAAEIKSEHDLTV